MRLTPQLITEKRKYLFHLDDASVFLEAKILFECVDHEGLGKNFKWRFVRCDFTTNNEIYTEDDWRFLGLIDDKIQELLKKLNK